MQDMRIEARMVPDHPADLGILARGILKQLDELKKDPAFLAEFNAWKEERENGRVQREA